MRNERLWALVLVALQCGLIGFVSGGYVFALIVMTIAGVGTFTQWRITVRPERLFIWTAVCIAFFLLKYRLAPVEFSADAYFIRTDLMHEMARCLAFIQAMQFVIRQPNDRLPLSLPALGAAAFICASDVEMGASRSIIVGMLAIAYVLGWAMFQMAWRHRDAVSNRAVPSGSVRRASRMRVVVVALLFVSLVFSTAAIARSVVQYHRPIDEWLVRQVESWLARWLRKDFGSSIVGFSERASLNSVGIRKSSNDDAISLRVFAEEEPGYLRGQVYIDYILGEWRSPASLRFPIHPAGGTPQGLPAVSEKGELFAYPGFDLPESRRWRSLECWRAESLKGISFSTLRTTHLQAETDEIRYRTQGLFDLGELPPGFPYIAWELTHPESKTKPLVRHSAEEIAQYLGLSQYHRPPQPDPPAIAEKPIGSPNALVSHEHSESLPRRTEWVDDWHGPEMELMDYPEVRPRFRVDWVGRVADVVFEGCETTEQKIAAVESYFYQNYEYHLGLQIPRNRWHDPDPLQYFLEEKPAAHCEYFASAAVILLRRVGVPARYVTGFVVSERNEIGGYWVARNRDAHAWCEAYDPQTGWTIVEATPAGGVPQSSTISAWQQWWEELKAAIGRLKVHIANQNWKRVWHTLWGSATSGFTVMILFGLGFWLYKRLPWRIRWSRRRIRPKDRWEAALGDMLQRMENELQPFGWKRSASETLHQFAGRVAQQASKTQTSDEKELERTHAAAVAEWLRTYAHLRYTRTPDEVMVLELRKTRPQL